MSAAHAFPAIHNAMWPGLVGKGGDAEPPIDLDTMLDLTAAAEVQGVRFDGVEGAQKRQPGRPPEIHTTGVPFCAIQALSRVVLPNPAGAEMTVSLRSNPWSRRASSAGRWTISRAGRGMNSLVLNKRIA